MSPVNPTEQELWLQRQSLARRARLAARRDPWYRQPILMDVAIGGLLGGLMGFLVGVFT